MCKTVGGPSANQPCVFPFKWSGKTYNSCPVDPDDSNETWCSTKTDSEGNHITGQGLWGQCGPKCKKEDWKYFSIGSSILSAYGLTLSIALQIYTIFLHWKGNEM